ncbi:MAG: NADH-quinone oxidoreductase subunit I [Dehalococcoidia bacterium]|nr:NADH-quinone oxidoreductase subunit I [Dehalococcoidia bacterium]
MSGGIGILKGLSVTMRQMFRKPVTVQYPEEKLAVPARIRGTSFKWYAELCTGCSMCARACPHGVIKVETHSADGASRIIDRYDIDMGLCMFCGLCVEACPFGALFLGKRIENSTYSRSDLYYTKERLTADDVEASEYYQSAIPHHRREKEVVSGARGGR